MNKKRRKAFGDFKFFDIVLYVRQDVLFANVISGGSLLFFIWIPFRLKQSILDIQRSLVVRMFYNMVGIDVLNKSFGNLRSLSTLIPLDLRN